MKWLSLKTLKTGNQYSFLYSLCYREPANLDSHHLLVNQTMSPIAPEDVVVLVANLLSLIVEILSLLLAYQTFVAMRHSPGPKERFSIERRRTTR
jgi:hypothetical protein